MQDMKGEGRYEEKEEGITGVKEGGKKPGSTEIQNKEEKEYRCSEKTRRVDKMKA